MTSPLALPGDRRVDTPSLAEHLAGRPEGGPAGIVAPIAAVAPILAARLALGVLPGDPGAMAGRNDNGDEHKALDVAAHEHLLAALARTGVRAVVSEEATDVIVLSDTGGFDGAIDPIDGSGSIGIGAPLGLFYAVFPAGGFLRSGSEIMAAGYVSFGHSVDLDLSLGDGAALATLDPATGTFHVAETGATFPAELSMIACNASNRRHLSAGLGAYLDDLAAGRDGPRGRDFNMRWLAAAVGELHRILHRGGLFLYPADEREGYEHGRRRRLYEAFRIPFLVEQAGGAATDGPTPILDRTPASLHQHMPLIFGARDGVATLHRYIARSG